MKVLLVGYGKMGQTVHQILKARGHEAPEIITRENADTLANLPEGFADAAIEFTSPESAVANLKACLQKKIPVATGTTGWLDHREEVETTAQEAESAFLYASNFSVGVNLFFKLNTMLAKLMQSHKNYRAQLEEIHHTQKKDAPSGTAITLAEGMLGELPQYTSWQLGDADGLPQNVLPITALREGNVRGIHEIRYQSAIDSLSIRHEAHSREGFAWGAVLAAEFLAGKKGIFTMDDVLGF